MVYRTTPLAREKQLRRMIRNPKHNAILEHLIKNGPSSFIELKGKFDMKPDTIATYARRLEEHGVLTVNRTFNGVMTHSIYSITNKGRDAFRDAIHFCRKKNLPFLLACPRRPNQRTAA